MGYSLLVGVHDRKPTLLLKEGGKMNYSQLDSDDGGSRICQGGEQGHEGDLECRTSAIDRVSTGGADIDKVDLKAVWARYDAEDADELESNDLLKETNRNTRVSLPFAWFFVWTS